MDDELVAEEIEIHPMVTEAALAQTEDLTIKIARLGKIVDRDGQVEGTFALAGAKIGLSQAAVSAQMQRLESRLGIEIFERKGRSSRLTRRGQQVLAQAQQLVSLYENLGSDAAEDHVVGPLNIGAIASVPRKAQDRDWIELLRTQPFIRYDRASFGGLQVDRFLRSVHCNPKQVCEVDELEAIVCLVSKGVGIALVPQTAAYRRCLVGPLVGDVRVCLCGRTVVGEFEQATEQDGSVSDHDARAPADVGQNLVAQICIGTAKVKQKLNAGIRHLLCLHRSCDASGTPRMPAWPAVSAAAEPILNFVGEAYYAR
jgi:hypothetical protein